MYEPLPVLIVTSRADLLDLPPAQDDVRLVVADEVPADIGGGVIAFVDWLLPRTSGLEACRRLRAMHALDAHITMVLDEDSDDSRARALRAGADDYLIGPLTAATLRNRLARCGRLAHPAQSAGRLVHGDLAIDLAAHQARWRGRLIALRPNELRLLALFAEQPDRLHSRTGLIAMLGKDGAGIDERTVDVWVGRLRRALKSHGVPEMLRTVRSQGYVLDSPIVEPLPLAS